MVDAWPGDRPLVVSHRGSAPGHRENTIEGARTAFASGADAIEVDVRLASDGVPVLHHDPELGGLPVAAATAATLEARARHLGWELARVDALLDNVGPERPINLEIKDPRATDPVLDLVDPDAWPPVLVSSFDPSVLHRVAEKAPGLPTGLVLGSRRAYRLLFSARRRRRLRTWLQGTRPDVLVLHRGFLRAGLAGSVLGFGIPVAVWTVNRPRSLAGAMQHPLVWGVVTDRPAAAHHARGLGSAPPSYKTPSAEEPVPRRTSSREPG